MVFRQDYVRELLLLVGVRDADRRNIEALASDGVSIAVSPGGIWEMVNTRHDAEQVFVMKKLGFIRIAMATSTPIVPIYTFGENQLFTMHRFMMGPRLWVARRLRFGIPLLTGRWGLPLPRPVKLVYVRGAPLGMPKIDEPTQQQIDEWHAKYVSEVTRIFNEHKGTLSDYAEKQLEMR